MSDGLEVREEGVIEKGVTNVGTDSAWMRRHLRDSIYLWACGEKADDEDDGPKLCDRLIGWLILFMQGFAYTMLIVLARATSKSGTGSSADDSHASGYLLASVTGAMYLLVASTTHDLRAGFSLLVDGSRAGHRAFGFGLLLVYGIMITAAMTVLVSTSEDSTSVVLNAVTVLFIADLDEKALHFLMTVPYKWRLFWAIESVGISFVLALVAIYYIGDDSPLLEGNNGIIKTYPTWFLWSINPVVVTLCSVVLSSTLRAGCEFLSEACEAVDEPTFGAMVASAYQVLMAAMKRAMQRFRREPCFHAAIALWLVQASISWSSNVERDNELPIAVIFNPPASENGHASLAITDNKLALLCSNGELVIGLAAKALSLFMPKNQRVAVVPAGRYPSEGGVPGEREGSCCADSAAPSVLIGSGIGYWIASLLYVLVCAWHGGGCGWSNAPIAVTIIGYVVIPCFWVACIFTVADTNFFGLRFGAFVKPAADILRDRRRVEFWIMAAVFRDFIDVWIAFCGALRSPLIYFM